MGFNTVVLVMNDFMHELAKAPHALAFAICHPPHSDADLEKYWWPQVMNVAEEHGEDARPLRGGLVVLPTFHTDDKHVLVAGWDQLIRPKYEEYKYNRKKNEMIIKMPEYWSR